ncbi:Peptidase S1 PA clan protein [Dioscorea alata]|uniref:Peptidase S1 PA clan protein n=6 Tax=Dioscorea alata TaxID=55571 RepID=A0ACB7U2E7_DIOAL|nr:Peptidase S1 PA clan protein [Dioscorea alata]KAH7654495.1 Peptidase S1 PA clan protein [Dioscorea alata]KAH7654496.1 Peptidase S1 PA clan protein [Dioscorea alata]KAH7654497.1 Peptidase S1 PA clan protein [Dioscorea alata]KAH7654498.1 Peptidase S1 PA clan protein [Dioscorea alata]
MMRQSDNRGNCSGSTQSEESALDMERTICNHSNFPSSSPSLQPFTSGGQHSESNAAYFSWPNSTLLHGAAEGRANYFGNLQKGVLPGHLDRLPTGQRATTLLDLMTIRAFHSKILRRYSLGTAIGFRIQKGELTKIPAILVFVARKVHRQWLSNIQCLPSALEGPGGVWCDVDVVEFSYYGAPAPTPKEQLYNELVDGLRGSDPCIGSGSQVASLETYGTLGAIVKSRSGNKQVGFLTNRHVAVDLDYPNQKMFHPLPPNLGPGVYLGAVERATSFITDDLWYGIFAGTNPETFVRADGAFIPFADDFDISNVTTLVMGVGEIGDVKLIDLQSPINSLIGRQVVKVGRSSGKTTGTVMAYALEYNDEKGICFFTDFLVVGESQQTFDLEGDSGSLIILTGQDGEKPQPIGIIWGGTANRGRLKLKSGHGPENWTSGVDLGRLLDLLELDLITTSAGLEEALQEQRIASAGVDSTVGESSPTLPKEKPEEAYESLGLKIQQLPVDDASGSGLIPPFTHAEFHVDNLVATNNVEEHQFIPSFIQSPLHRNHDDNSSELKSLSALRNSSDEDLCFSLQLGDREPKRQRTEPTFSNGSPK